MRIQKILCIALSLVLVFSLSACGQQDDSGIGDSEAPYSGDAVLTDGQFAPLKTELEIIETPDDLPIIPANYNDWDRTSEWLFISYIDSTKIYANASDTENLYLLWGDDFVKLPWKQAREAEEEVILSRYDADRDRATEVFAICDLSAGSNNYVRQEPHIIDVSSDGKYYDIEFPINDYWEWVLSKVEIDGEKVVLNFDEESFIFSGFLDEGENLSTQLSYFYSGPEETDNYSGELIVAVVFTTDTMKEIASFTSMISYNGRYFEVIDHMIAGI